MRIRWTGRASADLARLHDFLAAKAPDAATRVIGRLARAPDKLLDYPRRGEPLPGFAPREVRRLIVTGYELRYELAGDQIIVLRLWHHREHRDFDTES